MFRASRQWSNEVTTLIISGTVNVSFHLKATEDIRKEPDTCSHWIECLAGRYPI